MTVAGTLIALSLHIFINPLQLLPGGFSGIASLISYLVPAVDMSTMYILINIPLLIVALIIMRGDYTFKTIWATVVSSSVLAILPDELVFVEQPLISVVFAGFIFGMAVFLAHQCNGSNGGTEVIGKIVSIKRPELDISKSIMTLNMGILVVGSIIMVFWAGQNPICVLYSAMFITIEGTVLGMLGRGFNHPQKLLIITKNYQQIADAITERTHRGVTLLPTYDSEGGERDSKIVMVLCRYRQCNMLKHLVTKYDSEAFVIIKDIHYVFSRPEFIRGYQYDKK